MRVDPQPSTAGGARAPAGSGWALAPAGLLLAGWLAWIPASGGYFAGTWYPSAAAALALFTATVVGRRRWLPDSPPAQAAILALAGLVAWCYLSILWADGGADALDAANKLLLLLLSGWTMALVPWTPTRLAWVLGTWSVGVAVICAVELVRVDNATQLGPFFYGIRYATPLGYPNATAALAALALWPALLLAARREVSALARIFLLPVAVFLAGYAFLPQSRGTLLGLAVAAPLVLIVAGRRFALLVRALVVGAALTVVIPRTVTLYQTLDAGRLVGPKLDRTAQGLLLVTVLSLLVSALLVLAERRPRLQRVAAWRPRIDPPRRVVIGRAAAVVVILAVAAAAVPAVHLVSSVVKSGRTDASTGSVRLLSATPEERFDYIRVAWKLFKSEPLGGVGAGNFGIHYDALRHFEKHSQYTHNLVMRVLGENGVVGLLLLATTIIALTVGLIRSGRSRPGTGRALAAAAFGMGIYFLIHDSVDWMDEFPAIATPALAAPLAVAALLPGRQAGARSARSRRSLWARLPLAPRLSPAGTVIFVVAELALVLALGGPYLASRYITRARDGYAANTTQAYSDLSRASDLNPLSSDAMLTEGEIAIALEEDDRALTAFRGALARQDGWYPRLQLGILLAQRGQFVPALEEVRRAAALDRDDPLIKRATSLIAGHQRIDPLAFQTLYRQGAQSDVFQQRSIR